MGSGAIPPGLGGGSPLDGASMAAAPQQDDQQSQDSDVSAKLDMVLALLSQVAEKVGVGGQDEEDQQDDGQDESAEGDDSYSSDDSSDNLGGSAGPMKPRRSAFAGG